VNAWCDVFSRFVAVGTLVAVGFVCSGIFCLQIMCSLVCSVFYWLIGDALLMYCGVEILRLYLPCFDVCWSFGVAGLGWYPCSRLKYKWSVDVECRAWGLMTVLNRGFISPGFCSGMCLPYRWRDWM
jgi:hypothetical protein